jgi:hypothetical protein
MDASDIAPWPWPVWVFLAGVTLVVLAWGVIAQEFRRAPLTGPDVSALDAADGVGRCPMAHCGGLPATVVRYDIDGPVLVCPGCSDLGDIKGWWLA